MSIKPLCTIIFLMWSHSDEYLENCTFMCGLTCPQNGDEPNITENLKYLFIGESYDRTVNFFCAMDYTCTQIDQGTCTYNGVYRKAMIKDICTYIWNHNLEPYIYMHVYIFIFNFLMISFITFYS